VPLMPVPLEDAEREAVFVSPQTGNTSGLFFSTFKPVLSGIDVLWVLLQA